MKTVLHVVLVSAFAVTAFAQTPAPTVAPTAPAAPAVAASVAPAAAPVAPKVEEKQTPVTATTGDVTTGKAAWYGKKFNGRKTASGQRFNASSLTAASNTLPLGTLVKVTNLKNKKNVTVRINDRSPKQPDRIIDVTRAAAARLGMLKSGIAVVELKVVGNVKRGSKAMKKAKKA